MNKLIHSRAQFFRHRTTYFEMFSEKKSIALEKPLKLLLQDLLQII